MQRLLFFVRNGCPGDKIWQNLRSAPGFSLDKESEIYYNIEE